MSEYLKILEDISNLYLEYDEGDLLILAEISDNLQELVKKCSPCLPLKQLILILNALIIEVMEGELLDKTRSDLFSRGIDLLKNFIDRVYATYSSSEIPPPGKWIEGVKEQQENKLVVEELNDFLKENRGWLKKTGEKNPGKKETSSDKRDPETEKPVPEIVVLKRININDQSFKIFISDAKERLVAAQDYILELEKDHRNDELIKKLFRIFHTIKGECGFLKIDNVKEVTHAMESLLDFMEKYNKYIDGDMIELLLEGVDLVKDMLSPLAKGDFKKYESIPYDDLVKNILQKTGSFKPPIGEALMKRGELTKENLDTILTIQKEEDYNKKFGEIAVEKGYVEKESVTSVLEKKADFFINVKASQVNFLVEMIQELLIAQSQLEDARDEAGINQIRKITKELQNIAMQMRTVKIRNLFLQMKRVARDLGKELNKQVTIQLEGMDLEIDRNLVETLEEPLLHLLRNALDHGIEPGDIREKMGKPPEARIELKAERRGNKIIISVKDDGHGLDRDKIVDKAIKKSLISQEEAGVMPDNRVYKLIFLPGFSTTQEVSKISGRGFGMDIVSDVVKQARGQIEIETEKNSFTEFKLIFPLNMAIIDGMITRVRNNYFIIPVMEIMECLVIGPGDLFIVQNDIEVIKIRGEVIPVIYLASILNEELPPEKGGGKFSDDGEIIVVIVENNKNKYALVVDQILEKKEVAIKSLGKKFNQLRGISSGTIFSGGKIGFLLDTTELIQEPVLT